MTVFVGFGHLYIVFAFLGSEGEGWEVALNNSGVLLKISNGISES